MEAQQLLRDSMVEPTSDVIAAGLGPANSAYAQFVDGLTTHDTQINWRYYNDGKAWLGKALYQWTTSRGTQKETTVFWLSIWDGFFKVTFYLPEKARVEALTLPLDESTKEMILNAKQMGKLKFFPLTFDLCSDVLFDEIFALVDYKKSIK